MLRKKYSPVFALRGNRLRARFSDYPEEAARYLATEHWAQQKPLPNPQRPPIAEGLPFNDAPFDIDEVVVAIRNLKKNKSPGPDGLTAEIYQMLLEDRDILGTLTEVLNRLRIGDNWDVILDQSFVIQVPKPNKPPEDFSSYRPIA
eukprot:1078539-Amphidinium_carterae.1